MADERARKLRREMPDSERKLWWRLRLRQLEGCRFRRQHPIGPYILDFVCLERRFVIEVDGGHHGEPAQIEHDARRVVMRVSNIGVLTNLDGVVDTIRAELAVRPVFGRTRRS